MTEVPPVELFQSTDALVLGEIHGSAQIPAFALKAVSVAYEEQALVVLALEIWDSEQEAIDRYLGSKGDEVARAALLATPFWRVVRDGRSSQAMFELFETPDCRPLPSRLTPSRSTPTARAPASRSWTTR